jgi:ketosteroid isomerase-like protein
MIIKVSLGFLTLFLTGYAGRDQNISAQNTFKNEAEGNTAVSGSFSIHEKANSTSRNSVIGYAGIDKQIGNTKLNTEIMIENNKEILTRANEAVSRGDYETFLSYCTEDTHWTFVGDETLEGKEAVRQYMAKVYLEPPVFDVDTLIGEGDFVTVVGKISLKDKDGKTSHYSYCDVWRFRDGKLAELKAFVIEAE